MSATMGIWRWWATYDNWAHPTRVFALENGGRNSFVSGILFHLFDVHVPPVAAPCAVVDICEPLRHSERSESGGEGTLLLIFSSIGKPCLIISHCLFFLCVSTK